MRRGLEVEEDTGDDQGHDDVGDQSRERETGVADQTLPATPHAEVDLLSIGQREGRLQPLALGLLRPLGGAEGLGVGAVDRVGRLVLLDIGLQSLVMRAGLPRRRELVGSPGDAALEALPDNALKGARHGGEEVGRGGAGRALEAEVDEVLLGLVSAAKEDLPALVQHNGLVEQVVGTLGRLIDGNTGGAAKQLGLQAESLAELDGVGAVQTTGTVVPALERRTREGSLGDGDALPLTARHATHVLVADAGVDGVADAEHGHDDIPQVVGEYITGDALRERPRSTGPGSEGEGITNTELGEVHIDLGRVDGLTTVVRVHLVGGHA